MTGALVMRRRNEAETELMQEIASRAIRSLSSSLRETYPAWLMPPHLWVIVFRATLLKSRFSNAQSVKKSAARFAAHGGMLVAGPRFAHAGERGAGVGRH